MNMCKETGMFGKSNFDKKATKNTITNYLTWALVKMQMCKTSQHMNLPKSIMANGLGGAGAQQQWEDSKP